MVKCAVSGCPNHSVTGTQGVLDRPAKRFFTFPKDPAQVKVWLAALRETEQQDWTEPQLICEDHFLPEDVSADGLSSDAIPIRPYPDGLLGPSSSWQSPDVRRVKRSVGAQSVPLERLTQRLLRLLLLAPEGSLDLRQATESLRTRGHRVFSLVNVLDEISLVQKEPADRIRSAYRGTTPISSFLWKSPEKFRREVEKMRLVEDALDAIIEGCARRLFWLTDRAENLASAYVTRQDIGRLSGFQDQTVIAIRAPEGTELEIPSPEDPVLG